MKLGRYYDYDIHENTCKHTADYKPLTNNKICKYSQTCEAYEHNVGVCEHIMLAINDTKRSRSRISQKVFSQIIRVTT